MAVGKSLQSWTYLALAVIGAAAPLSRLARRLADDLPSLPAAAWPELDAVAAGLVDGLTVGVAAVTAFAIFEALGRRDPLLLIAAPAAFLVGVSFGLPLLLFLRVRRGR